MILHIGISDNLRQKQLANFEECWPKEHQYLTWKLSQPIKDGINVVLLVKIRNFSESNKSSNINAKDNSLLDDTNLRQLQDYFNSLP